jgi:hypothetical protein
VKVASGKVSVIELVTIWIKQRLKEELPREPQKWEMQETYMVRQTE